MVETPLENKRLLVRVTVAVVYPKGYMGLAERLDHNGEESSVSRLKILRLLLI